MVASKTEKASSSRQEKVHQSTRNLRLRIFFSVFLDLLAFTAILPHFPTLVKNVGGTSGEADTAATHLLRSLAALIGMPIHHPLHYVVLGGLIGTLLSLGSFLSGPCLGYVADNTILGRRRSLLLTLGISFVAHLGMVLCTTVDRVTNTVAVPLVWLLVLRFFTGVGKSNVSLSVAILDDAALHEGDAQKIAAARKKGVAMIGIAYAVGFLVGPPLSVWMMRGLGVSFVKWSLFAQGVAFLFTCISIPETRRDMPGCAHRSEDSRPCLQSEVFASLKNETVSATRYTINPCHLFSPSHNLVPIPLHTVYFLFLMLYSSAEFSLAFLQLTLMRNTSVHRQAFSYVWIGTVMILVQGGYVRRTQCSSSAILFQGLVSFFIALLILVMFSMQPGLCFLFYIALTFMGFSSATVVSSATTLALNLAQAYIDNRKPNAEDREHKVISALVTSRLRSAGHLARACGPFVGSIWFALKGEAIFFLTHASLLGLLICYTFYIFRHVIKA